MSLAKSTDWQTRRALLLHRKFGELEIALSLGAKQKDELSALARELKDYHFETRDPRGKTVQKPLKASAASLLRNLHKWREGNRSPESLLLKYTSTGSHTPMPPQLKMHIQSLGTQSLGGRNKKGVAPTTFARNQLHKAWKAGEEVPGLGTWENYWLNTHPNHLLPDHAPDFPWCDKTISRHIGHETLRQWGNVGFASARNQLPRMERDYSQLRKAELITLDDVRLDIIAIDEFTGQAVEVTAYITMEVGSRYIPAFILRTKSGIKSRDVDALLADTLQTTGVGIGYKTTILFERGTVACSDESKAILESTDRIRVRKTGMLNNVKWVGAAADQAKGNAAGKAVIESFNRSLHYRLLHLPGQRGNTRENTPDNLGVEKRDHLKGEVDRKRGKKRKAFSQRSLVEQSEMISIFKRSAQLHGFDCHLEFPILTVAQLEAEVQHAIDAHNNDPGHNYQGHHQHVQIESAPGVWKNLHN